MMDWLGLVLVIVDIPLVPVVTKPTRIVGWPFDCKQYVTDAGQLPTPASFPAEFGAGLMVDKLDKVEV